MLCVSSCFEGFWCIHGLPILSEPDKLAPSEAEPLSGYWCWSSIIPAKPLHRLLVAIYDGLETVFLYRKAKYKELAQLSNWKLSLCLDLDAEALWFLQNPLQTTGCNVYDWVYLSFTERQHMKKLEGVTDITYQMVDILQFYLSIGPWELQRGADAPHPPTPQLPNADSLLLSTLLMQQPVVPHLQPSSESRISSALDLFCIGLNYFPCESVFSKNNSTIFFLFSCSTIFLARVGK